MTSSMDIMQVLMMAYIGNIGIVIDEYHMCSFQLSALPFEEDGSEECGGVGWYLGNLCFS